MTYARIREDSVRYKKSASKGKSTLYHNGWVLLFIAACGIIYFNALGRKNQVLAVLDQQLKALEVQQAMLLGEKEDLMLQIQSQSDPAWIQLILMKELGLVPEGQTKVYFH